MKRLGFTPKRPLYRAWQQDAQWVDRWTEEDYPKIIAKAKKEKGLLFDDTLRCTAPVPVQ